MHELKDKAESAKAMAQSQLQHHMFATAHTFAFHSTVAVEQGRLQHMWAGMSDHSFLNMTSQW